MVKLSELDKDTKVIYGETVYSVEDVRNDLAYFTEDEERKLYTTTEYHAHIDAAALIDTAIEDENCSGNMYEDWDEKIKFDITDEDIQKIQAILDDILSRDTEQNTTYYEGKEIEIDE